MLSELFRLENEFARVVVCVSICEVSIVTSWIGFLLLLINLYAVYYPLYICTENTRRRIVRGESKALL